MQDMNDLLNSKDGMDTETFHEKLVAKQTELREAGDSIESAHWYEKMLESGDSKDAWRVMRTLATPRHSKDLGKPDLDFWCRKFS